MTTATVPLPVGAAAELARRLGWDGPLGPGAQWVGTTSTVTA